MSSPGATELLIVLVIVVLILGPKRLPSLGRQLGGGIREFRRSFGGSRSTRRQAEDAALRETTTGSAAPVPPTSPAPAELDAQRRLV